MSLSAAIIVKDEAERLDECLSSLDGLVDEIIVVDTGSGDATVSIAEQHGAVIVREPGQGELALTRNRGLELATGDWILSVDADERVEGDFDDVRALLAAADASLAFRVRSIPRVGWTPVCEHRLWRNRPDIRFVGQIHESILPAIEAAADAEALAIGVLDRFTVQPVGDERDRPGTRARDEPLLVAELDRDPDRAAVYDDLARFYEAAGDGERAVETWKRGIAQARGRGTVHPDDRLLYVDLIHHLLANGGIDDELEILVDEARGKFARTPTLELAAARLAFATGRPREALEPLEWLVGLDDDAIMATGVSYDQRVFGEWAWALLGLCCFALDDDAAAAAAFARAEQFAPGDASYGVRRRLAEARASTPTPSPS